MKALAGTLILLIGLGGASGCRTTREHLLDAGVNQAQLRSIQSRVFDTSDRDATLRAVIATLQDLDFLIDDADDQLGVVSATKLARYTLSVSVLVRSHGEHQHRVRVNMQYREKPVQEPEHYQRFFSSLEKALFLSAQTIP